MDGVLIANELINDAKKGKKKEVVFFKVDFEKAYDSVNWEFLDFMMAQMGFSYTWRKWIKECLSSPTVSVLINESPTEEFKVGRGLWQGDLLSPFLFLIVAEGLNILFRKAVEGDFFSGYKVGELKISHLQFADDTLIKGEKCSSNIWTIKAVLQLFECISGLKVHFYKSQLYGVNVRDDWRQRATEVLNCNVGVLPFTYLGLPIGVGNVEKVFGNQR